MLKKLRARLTFANVVSLIALFIALGGVALALERNSVQSRHIAPNAAKGIDVAEETLEFACPSGTRDHAGACMEETARSEATWADAAEICGAAGRRLPTLAELQSFRQESGITLAPNGEYSSEIQVRTAGGTSTSEYIQVASLFDDGTFQLDNIRVGQSGDIDETSNADNEKFRCVAERP